MVVERTWKVGGKQGEGIDSTGEILAKVLNRRGHYIFAYRHFMSLIKGGHTNYKIRIKDRSVHYHGDDLDILIAFDQRTIEENWKELHNDSLIIYDSSKQEMHPVDDVITPTMAPIPITSMAKELGNEIIKNMIACGASAAALGLKPSDFDEVIEELFSSKGDKIIDLNRQAIQKGYDYYNQNFQRSYPLPEAKGKELYLVSGNEMIGLGSLLGGCRYLSAYPITPATEIMYWLLHHLPKFGGRVVQMEDEIAACIMAIGANYAGVRAATSTSGPGLSLMMESLGLAGISETPLVIFDVQRGGPGTGLPTKTEQSDLNEMLYGSHGEIPRIVLVPSTIEECLSFAHRAFDLAEKYQCPVIVGSDLFLGMSKKSSDTLNAENYAVEQRYIISQEELDAYERGTFKRYRLDVQDGISPRSIPGQRNGRYVALSNEHDEVGIEIEEPTLRKVMFEKRMKKLVGFDLGEFALEYIGDEDPTLLLVCFGSVRNQMEEVLELLQEKGKQVALLIIKQLKPFPKDRVAVLMERAKRILVVENNGTGQFANLLLQEVGQHGRIEVLLKFDGNPYTVTEILRAVEQKEGVIVR